MPFENPSYMPGAEEARCFQFDAIGPKKQMLLFPRWDAFDNQTANCIYHALNANLINRRTQILCVERHPHEVPHIASEIELCGLTSRTRVHVGKLHNLTLKSVERFDFACFDFGLIPSKETVIWMGDVFTKNVVDGADISFGIRYKDYGSELLHTCRLAFKTHFRRHAALLRKAYGITDPNIMNHVLLLFTIFKDFDFDTDPEMIYNPGQALMVAVKFTGLKRRETPLDWPSIQDVLAAGQPLWDALDRRRQEAIDRKDEKKRLRWLVRKELQTLDAPA